jgi:hypothetical protein
MSIVARKEQQALLVEKREEEERIRIAIGKIRKMISTSKEGDLNTCTDLLLVAIKSPEGVEASLEFIRLWPWKFRVTEVKSFVEISGEGEKLLEIFLDRLFDSEGRPCWTYKGHQQEGEPVAFYFAVLSIFTAMEAAKVPAGESQKMASSVLDAYLQKIYEGDPRLQKMIEGVEKKGHLPHRQQPFPLFPQTAYADLGDGGQEEEATPQEVLQYKASVPKATVPLGEVAIRKNGKRGHHLPNQDALRQMFTA